MQTTHSMIKELSPAKINLFLQVTGRRPDGYHELNTLMCGITLFDTIFFDFRASGLSVQCDHPEVPEDNTNLVWKAATLFFKTCGIQAGVKIQIEKKIPVGAGLGGGSSNAATVLKALNKYFGSLLPDEKLRAIGLEIGADVPFFIQGRPAVAKGIGEKLIEYDLLQKFHVLLINPGINVSTAEVYKNLNLGLTKCEKIITKFPFSGVSVDICNYLCNDLETVTTKMIPDIERIKALLMKFGSQGALMTGSGPTVFGLFSDSNQAKFAYRELKQFPEKQKFLAELIV
jgi:4-diphosphocytidyl-2-C-methyl-D-erythritol kinase